MKRSKKIGLAIAIIAVVIVVLPSCYLWYHTWRDSDMLKREPVAKVDETVVKEEPVVVDEEMLWRNWLENVKSIDDMRPALSQIPRGLNIRREILKKFEGFLREELEEMNTMEDIINYWSYYLLFRQYLDEINSSIGKEILEKGLNLAKTFEDIASLLEIISCYPEISKKAFWKLYGLSNRPYLITSFGDNFNSPAKMKQRKFVIGTVMIKMEDMYNHGIKVPGYEVSASGCEYHLCPSGQEDGCGKYTSIINFQYACGCKYCNFGVVIDSRHLGQRGFSGESVMVYISSEGEMFGAGRAYEGAEKAIQEFLAAEPLRN